MVRWAARIALVIGLVTVSWASLAPSDDVPLSQAFSDKLLHFTGYALLGVAAALAQRRRRVILTVALLTAFGLLIEILQGMTGYRSFDVVDLLADTLGATAGVVLVVAASAWSQQRHDGSMRDESQEWDERYSDDDRIWSGMPNGALVAEVESMAPGRAADIGCGEGADAVWLAQHGWNVTAIDVSAVALERAAAAAAAAEVDVDFRHAGLLAAALPAAQFDLVSVQYPALRRTPDNDAERELCSAVAVDGILLAVFHAAMQDHSHAHDAASEFNPADYVQREQLLAVLGDDWTIEVDEVRPRSVTSGRGAHHMDDLVVKARRRR